MGFERHWVLARISITSAEEPRQTLKALEVEGYRAVYSTPPLQHCSRLKTKGKKGSACLNVLDVHGRDGPGQTVFVLCCLRRVHHALSPVPLFLGSAGTDFEPLHGQSADGVGSFSTIDYQIKPTHFNIIIIS